MAVDGLGVAYVTAGLVLLWSGVKNATIKETLTGFLKGQVPQGTPAAPPASSGTGETTSGGTVVPVGGTVSGASESSNQAAAALQAAAYGWVGAQWTALNNVEMAEAGWNNLAQNPSSGAFGIAQALGHGGAGTAGKYGNNYGAQYGLSVSSAVAANNGSAGPQIQWMLGYISATYGNPENAWAHEQSYHWY